MATQWSGGRAGGFLDINKTNSTSSNGPSSSNKSGGSDDYAEHVPATGFKAILPEMLACFSANTFHMALGLTLAYSAVLLPQLEKPDSDVKITKTEAAWIASVIALAVPVGSLITGPIMEALGRLRTIQMAVLPFCAGCALIATATGVPAIIAGRLLCGFVAGTLGTNPGIVYITEVARPNLRGSLISTGPFLVSVGTMAMYVLGAYLHWRTVAWVCFCAPLLPVICTALFSPESPAWLVARGRTQEAVRSTAFLAKNDPARLARVDREVADLAATLEERRATQRRGLSGFLAAVFLQRSGIRPLCVIAVLFALQQFSGTYVVLFFAVSFFKDVGSALDPNVASMVVGGIRVFMSVMATILMRRFGRRPLLLVSAMCCAVCMMTSGYFARVLGPSSGGGNNTVALRDNSSVYLEQVPDDPIPEYVHWIPMLAIMVFVSASMVGILTIPWTMTAELYPGRIRGLCQGISVSIANFFMFLSVQSYQEMAEALGGVYAAHWVYAGVCLVGAVFVYLCVPETHGRTLAEIEVYFETSMLYPLYERRQRQRAADLSVNQCSEDLVAPSAMSASSGED